MQHYICFQMVDFDTKQPLNDFHCWTFKDPELYDSELKRLQHPKMVHIKVICHGLTRPCYM